jgi:pyruvate dehydrogenase E1 component
MQAKAQLEQQIISKQQAPLHSSDSDPQETAEWLEAWDQILDEENPQRASYLLTALTERARSAGLELPPPSFNTPYWNTIRVEDELPYPGDLEIERRIKSVIRWNAMAMVVQQNKKDSGIGGHIATYASTATLMEVGFNHFFRAKIKDQAGVNQPGDFVYFQGHASPGIYSRAFLEGRFSATNCAKIPVCLRIRTPG